MALRSFKMDEELDRWLRDEAASRDMSVSAFIRVCLDKVRRSQKR